MSEVLKPLIKMCFPHFLKWNRYLKLLSKRTLWFIGLITNTKWHDVFDHTDVTETAKLERDERERKWGMNNEGGDEGKLMFCSREVEITKDQH